MSEREPSSGAGVGEELGCGVGVVGASDELKSFTIEYEFTTAEVGISVLKVSLRSE